MKRMYLHLGNSCVNSNEDYGHTFFIQLFTFYFQIKFQLVSNNNNNFKCHSKIVMIKLNFEMGVDIRPGNDTNNSDNSYSRTGEQY